MTKGDLAVEVTLEKRPINTGIEQNNCQNEHLETKNLPYKKIIHTKNISESTPKSSLKKIKVQVNRFKCEICGDESAKQFDFYTHLKIHYENTKHVNLGIGPHSKLKIEPKRLKTIPGLQDDALVINNKDIILVIPENILGLKTCQENVDDVDFQEECLKAVLEDTKVVLNENSSNEAEELLEDDQYIEVEAEQTKIIKKNKVKCDKKYTCKSCGKIFLSSAAKSVHQRIHSDSRPFPCTTCGLSFRQLGDLRYHNQSKHSEIPEFQCEFCGKEFARKYSLTLHRKIHTGELSHHCDFCDKSFRAAVYLQNHRRIHTGEKPFSCSKCSKKFRVKSDVNRHLKVHEARKLKSSSKLESSQIDNFQAEEAVVVSHEELLVGEGLLDVGIVLN